MNIPTDESDVEWHVSIPLDVRCPCPHEFTETCTWDELEEDLHRYGVLGDAIITSLTIRPTFNEETGKTVWEWLYKRDGEFLRGGYCNTREDAVHNAIALKPLNSEPPMKETAPMKTRTTHLSNFGSFRPVGLVSDWNGYAEYHDSRRYEEASGDQLREWLESPRILIRNAAAIELAERALVEWRKGNE